MTVQKISVCVRPTQDKGGREACQNFLLQPSTGGPVCWRWHTCQRYKHSFQGGGCWILGAKEISRLTYKHRLLFYFSLFPHTGGRVNKMLRLQWTGGALETAVGNEAHAALPHMCFPNECRSINTQQLFKVGGNTNEQALGSLHWKPKFVLYFKKYLFAYCVYRRKSSAIYSFLVQ